MMSPSEVEALIRAGLPCEHLEVAGDGHHFEALVVSAEFAGKARLARQQRVLQTVRPQIESNALHALSMRTLTPAEWQAERGRG
jgi:acid stress-induced BolA-like protein IbaG/YrbA